MKGYNVVLEMKELMPKQEMKDKEGVGLS